MMGTYDPVEPLACLIDKLEKGGIIRACRRSETFRRDDSIQRDQPFGTHGQL